MPGGEGLSDRAGEFLSGRADEPFFRTVAATAPTGIVVVDDSTTVVYANEAAGRSLGRSSDTLVGDPLSSLVPGEARHDVAALRIALREGDPSLEWDPLEIPVGGDSGDRRIEIAFRTVDHDGDRLGVGVVREASTGGKDGQALERYERIIDTIDDGIYVLDANFTITDVNSAVTAMTGYDRDELIGSHASMLADESVLEEAARLSAELLENSRDAATLTATLRTADGGHLPIETRFSLYPFDDQSYGQVGVVRDITDRKRFEETLTSLNEVARELLSTDTESDVCRLITDAATDVIDLSAAVVYLFDREANTLEPIAASRNGGAPDGPPTIRPGDGAAWEAFVDGRTVTVDADDEGLPRLSGASARCVSLGDRGVFVAAAERTAFDEDTRTLVDLLAASAEAALSRVGREIALRERDRELKRRNRRLRRLDRINAIIREIDQALVGADTRRGIAEAVCDRLVAADRFTFAWIGDADTVAGAIDPRAWAGDGQGYLDDVSLVLDNGGTPAIRAATAGEMTVVEDVSERIRDEPWRKAALPYDFRSVVSVPLIYDEVSYGVLTVAANQPSAFDEMTQAVFGELAETIASAMNALETKRALRTDAGVELEFHLDGADDPLVRLSRRSACRLTVKGVLPKPDGSSRVFFTASDVSPEDVVAVEEESVAVESIRHVADRDGDHLFEAVVTGTTVESTLVDHGAAIETMNVDDDGVEIVAELPRDADVRTLVERVRSQFPGAELVSRRQRDRPIQTGTGFRAAFEDRLTDRQEETLRVAYLSGFFDWPRGSTGEEIADSLGISGPALNRLLRAGQRKLLDLLYEER